MISCEPGASRYRRVSAASAEESMAWRRSAGLLDAPPVVVQPVVSTVAAASDAPVTMKLRLFMLFWRMEDTVRAFLGGDRSAGAATGASAGGATAGVLCSGCKSPQSPS